MLRKWAETGKAYRDLVFSKRDVEAAIAAYERHGVSNVASPQKEKEWWPRWALNKARGVEVLAPLKGKASWSKAGARKTWLEYMHIIFI